ncbi:LysR family transcriptional regulator [Undibacterium sp.]|jgi:DNA-binding transcriptional LysR family regulator|uniref:LysR family transcriptional regulator n=1 Tax=Undibacterium sp. TaxID=1914977 RepID=UPI002C715F94|nr:LysR family transcriptional regulator [Undibacterium sp.]HTD04114.1 LysR family transcriptional regulator [Undibacterium sp.]
MNLRRLSHLLALADEGSFAKAAEKIHLSQPALSRSIQSLEAELDMQLCERQTRGVILTAAGKMVVERARRVLAEARALDRDVNLFKNHELGEVSFGFGPYPAAILMADVLAALSTSYPRLTVHSEVSNWTSLLEGLRTEALDFFIVERRAVLPAPELSTQLLSLHQCGWFARPEHPVFRQAKLTLSALRQLRLASVPLPGHMHQSMRRMLKCKPSEELHFHVECNSFFVLKQLAEKSDTVVYGMTSSLQQELRQGSLRQIHIEDFKGFSMQFVLVHLAHRSISPTAQQAMTAVLQCDKHLL